MACIRGERPVFSGVSFRLERGGALALVGPNGAGKSSLLRILAGLLKRAGGTLTWDGAPVDDDWAAHRGRLHYVGHLDAVKPTLTVAENLDGWGAGFRGAARASPEALADARQSRASPTLPGRFLSAGPEEAPRARARSGDAGAALAPGRTDGHARRRLQPPAPAP